jgi:hypothetical protein
VNTSNNPSHCGTCNKVCSSVGGTPSCNSGTCSISCTAPNANCDGNVDNGCEVNTSNTPAHCGGCNQACTSGFTCDTGVCKCTATSCQAGTCNSEGKCVCGTTTCSYNQTCTGSNCT